MNKFDRGEMNKIQSICSLHQSNNLDYVCIDSTEDCVFKCMYCVTDEDVKQHTLIPIKQIALASEKTIFANFPFSDRTFTKQIRDIVSKPPSGDVLQTDIENFFKDLRANILSKIENIQNNMLKKAQSITDINGDVAQLYNTFSEKWKLKEILINSEKSLSGKSAEIKVLCAEVMSKQSENKQAIEAAINKVEELKKAIDFETPKLIKEDVLRKLDAIDMFLIEDVADFSESIRISNKNQNSYSTILDLIKLVQNKFKKLSEEQCITFKEQINKIISDQQLVQKKVEVGISHGSMNALTASQIEVINGFIDEIARMNSDVNNNQKEKEQIKSERLFELMSNQTNFCSNEYLVDVKQVMDKLKGVFSLFRIRKLNVRTQEQTAFTRLKKHQLLNLARLANKLNELTAEKDGSYLNCKCPYVDIQSNSTIVNSSLMRDSCELVNGGVKLSKQDVLISQLLVDFPIFELLPEFQKANPLLFNFMKTKYQQSSEMEIAKSLNEVQFRLNAKKIGQVVSEILKNDSGYLLKLKFNKSIGRHSNGSFFSIGLVQNRTIDIEWLYLYDSHSGFISSQGYGNNIIKRGGRLSNVDLLSVTSSLEFRWCIARKQFFVTDSTYTNINQLEERKFNSAEQYRFGVCFYNLVDDGWEVTITEFTEINPEEVNKFG